MPIKAVSFDIWDTLLVDDSDEPKRKSAGLLSKSDARVAAIFEVAKKYNSSITLPDVQKAYNENFKIFNKLWYESCITQKVPARITDLLNLLNIAVEPAELAEITTCWEEMEYTIPPDAVPGAKEALARLSGHYKLGIISDTVVSPGRLLKEILKKYDMLQYFSVFTFSDAVGVSKPSPAVFNDFLNQMNLKPHEVVHIGDRPHNDIDGPKNVGMRALLFDGVEKRALAKHKPDAVFSDYAELFDLIKRL
ncbi:MAG: HAD family hydrolase [Deltaproteobacteria bacterium]|nr:HAD family hydrolase [Deltaproteobacteria bacterium]